MCRCESRHRVGFTELALNSNSNVPQESLKEGMDLSAAINRIRFDGLAAGVYRRIGEAVKSALAAASLDIAQLDEVSQPRRGKSIYGSTK
jgi:molecular chaperone DnaK (HSP70)